MSNTPEIQIATDKSFFNYKLDFDEKFAIKIYTNENDMSYFSLTLNILLDILKKNKKIIEEHFEQKYRHILNQKD